jgi:hypothetical protein
MRMNKITLSPSKIGILKKKFIKEINKTIRKGNVMNIILYLSWNRSFDSDSKLSEVSRVSSISVLEVF